MRKSFLGILLIVVVSIITFLHFQNNDQDVLASQSNSKTIHCSLDDGSLIDTEFDGTCEQFITHLNNMEEDEASKTQIIYESTLDNRTCKVVLGSIFKGNTIGRVIMQFRGELIKDGTDINCDLKYPIISGNSTDLLITDTSNAFYYFSDIDSCTAYINKKQYSGNSVEKCTTIARNLTK